MKLPPPTIIEHEGILVVRDDLLAGGTKVRAMDAFIDNHHNEYVYASPAYGYAQVAIAYACQDRGKKATIFIAKRKINTEPTNLAIQYGAKIVHVPMGYLSNVRSKAKGYCLTTGASLLPFGLDTDDFRDRISYVALSLDVFPTEVWCVAGSGTLTRALQTAWPDAIHNVVQIGRELKTEDIWLAKVHTAPERFEQPAKYPPPFPSCKNYDAKAWQFIKRLASPKALFWNVAS